MTQETADRLKNFITQLNDSGELDDTDYVFLLARIESLET